VVVKCDLLLKEEYEYRTLKTVLKEIAYFNLKQMEQMGEEMNLEFHWSRCMIGSFLKE
jgi:hypothetical protein